MISLINGGHGLIRMEEFARLCERANEYPAAFKQALSVVCQYQQVHPDEKVSVDSDQIKFSNGFRGDPTLMSLAILRSKWRRQNTDIDEQHPLNRWMMRYLRLNITEYGVGNDEDDIYPAISFCFKTIRDHQWDHISELAAECLKIFTTKQPLEKSLAFHSMILKEISSLLVDYDGQLCGKQVNLSVRFYNNRHGKIG